MKIPSTKGSAVMAITVFMIALFVISSAIYMNMTQSSSKTTVRVTANNQLYRACESALEISVGIMNRGNNWKTVYKDGNPISELDGTTEYILPDLNASYKVKAYRISDVRLFNPSNKPTDVVAIGIIAKIRNSYTGSLSVFYPTVNRHSKGSVPLFGGPVYSHSNFEIGSGVDMHWGPMINSTGQMRLHMDPPPIDTSKKPFALKLWPRKLCTGSIAYPGSSGMNNVRKMSDSVPINNADDEYWETHDYGKIVAGGHGRNLRDKIDLIDKNALRDRARSYSPPDAGTNELTITAAAGFDWANSHTSGGYSGYLRLSSISDTSVPTIVFDGWQPDEGDDAVFFVEEGNLNILIKGEDTCLGNKDTPVLFFAMEGSLNLIIDSTWEGGKSITVELPENAELEYRCENRYGLSVASIPVLAPDFFANAGWSGNVTIDNVFFYGALIQSGSMAGVIQNNTRGPNIDASFIGVLARKRTRVCLDGSSMSFYYNPATDGMIDTTTIEMDYTWSALYKSFSAGSSEYDGDSGAASFPLTWKK